MHGSVLLVSHNASDILCIFVNGVYFRVIEFLLQKISFSIWPDFEHIFSTAPVSHEICLSITFSKVDCLRMHRVLVSLKSVVAVLSLYTMELIHPNKK